MAIKIQITTSTDSSGGLSPTAISQIEKLEAALSSASSQFDDKMRESLKFFSSVVKEVIKDLANVQVNLDAVMLQNLSDQIANAVTAGMTKGKKAAKSATVAAAATATASQTSTGQSSGDLKDKTVNTLDQTLASLETTIRALNTSINRIANSATAQAATQNISQMTGRPQFVPLQEMSEVALREQSKELKKAAVDTVKAMSEAESSLNTSKQAIVKIGEIFSEKLSASTLSFGEAFEKQFGSATSKSTSLLERALQIDSGVVDMQKLTSPMDFFKSVDESFKDLRAEAEQKGNKIPESLTAFFTTTEEGVADLRLALAKMLFSLKDQLQIDPQKIQEISQSLQGSPESQMQTMQAGIDSLDTEEQKKNVLEIYQALLKTAQEYDNIAEAQSVISKLSEKEVGGQDSLLTKQERMLAVNRDQLSLAKELNSLSSRYQNVLQQNTNLIQKSSDALNQASGSGQYNELIVLQRQYSNQVQRTINLEKQLQTVIDKNRNLATAYKNEVAALAGPLEVSIKALGEPLKDMLQAFASVGDLQTDSAVASFGKLKEAMASAMGEGGKGLLDSIFDSLQGEEEQLGQALAGAIAKRIQDVAKDPSLSKDLKATLTGLSDAMDDVIKRMATSGQDVTVFKKLSQDIKQQTTEIDAAGQAYVRYAEGQRQAEQQQDGVAKSTAEVAEVLKRLRSQLRVSDESFRIVERIQRSATRNQFDFNRVLLETDKLFGEFESADLLDPEVLSRAKSLQTSMRNAVREASAFEENIKRAMEISFKDIGDQASAAKEGKASIFSSEGEGLPEAERFAAIDKAAEEARQATTAFYKTLTDGPDGPIAKADQLRERYKLVNNELQSQVFVRQSAQNLIQGLDSVEQKLDSLTFEFKNLGQARQNAFSSLSDVQAYAQSFKQFTQDTASVDREIRKLQGSLERLASARDSQKQDSAEYKRTTALIQEQSKRLAELRQESERISKIRFQEGARQAMFQGEMASRAFKGGDQALTLNPDLISKDIKRIQSDLKSLDKDVAAGAIQSFQQLRSEVQTNANTIRRSISDFEALEQAGVKLDSADRKYLNTLKEQEKQLQKQLIAFRMLDNTQKTAAKRVEFLSRSFNDLSEQLGQAFLSQMNFMTAAGLVAGAATAISMGFREILSDAKALTRAFTVLQSATKSFTDIQKIATDQAREAAMRFGIPLYEVANVTKELGSAGLTFEQVSQALIPTLKTINATGAETTQITRAVAGIFNVYGKSMKNAGQQGKEFTEITNTLTTIFRNHQAEMDEIVQGYKFVIGTGKAAGFTFQDMGAYLAVLNDNMIKSGMAGRGLQRVFAQLAAKSSQLRDIGIKIDVKADPGSQFESVLEQLSEKFGQGSINVQQFDQLFSIFDAQGARVVATLASNFDQVQKALRQMRDESEGVTDELSAIVANSLDRKFQQMRQAALDLARSGFDTLKATVIPLFDVFKGLAITVANFNKATGGVASEIAVGAGAFLMMAQTLRVVAMLFNFFVTSGFVKMASSLTAMGTLVKANAAGLLEYGKTLKVKMAEEAAAYKTSVASSNAVVAAKARERQAAVAVAAAETNLKNAVRSGATAKATTAAASLVKAQAELQDAKATTAAALANQTNTTIMARMTAVTMATAKAVAVKAAAMLAFTGVVGVVGVGVALLAGGLMSYMKNTATAARVTEILADKMDILKAKTNDANRNLRNATDILKDLQGVSKNIGSGVFNPEQVGAALRDQIERLGDDVVMNTGIITMSNQQIGESYKRLVPIVEQAAKAKKKAAEDSAKALKKENEELQKQRLQAKFTDVSSTLEQQTLGSMSGLEALAALRREGLAANALYEMSTGAVNTLMGKQVVLSDQLANALRKQAKEQAQATAASMKLNDPDRINKVLKEYQSVQKVIASFEAKGETLNLSKEAQETVNTVKTLREEIIKMRDAGMELDDVFETMIDAFKIDSASEGLLYNLIEGARITTSLQVQVEGVEKLLTMRDLMDNINMQRDLISLPLDTGMFENLVREAEEFDRIIEGSRFETIDGITTQASGIKGVLQELEQMRATVGSEGTFDKMADQFTKSAEAADILAESIQKFGLQTAADRQARFVEMTFEGKLSTKNVTIDQNAYREMEDKIKVAVTEAQKNPAIAKALSLSLSGINMDEAKASELIENKDIKGIMDSLIGKPDEIGLMTTNMSDLMRVLVEIGEFVDSAEGGQQGYLNRVTQVFEASMQRAEIARRTTEQTAAMVGQLDRSALRSVESNELLSRYYQLNQGVQENIGLLSKQKTAAQEVKNQLIAIGQGDMVSKLKSADNISASTLKNRTALRDVTLQNLQVLQATEVALKQEAEEAKQGTDEQKAKLAQLTDIRAIIKDMLQLLSDEAKKNADNIKKRREIAAQIERERNALKDALYQRQQANVLVAQGVALQASSLRLQIAQFKQKQKELNLDRKLLGTGAQSTAAYTELVNMTRSLTEAREQLLDTYDQEATMLEETMGVVQTMLSPEILRPFVKNFSDILSKLPEINAIEQKVLRVRTSFARGEIDEQQRQSQIIQLYAKKARLLQDMAKANEDILRQLDEQIVRDTRPEIIEKAVRALKDLAKPFDEAAASMADMLKEVDPTSMGRAIAKSLNIPLGQAVLSSDKLTKQFLQLGKEGRISLDMIPQPIREAIRLSNQLFKQQQEYEKQQRDFIIARTRLVEQRFAKAMERGDLRAAQGFYQDLENNIDKLGQLGVEGQRAVLLATSGLIGMQSQLLEAEDKLKDGMLFSIGFKNLDDFKKQSAVIREELQKIGQVLDGFRSNADMRGVAAAIEGDAVFRTQEIEQNLISNFAEVTKAIKEFGKKLDEHLNKIAKKSKQSAGSAKPDIRSVDSLTSESIRKDLKGIGDLPDVLQDFMMPVNSEINANANRLIQAAEKIAGEQQKVNVEISTFGKMFTKRSLTPMTKELRRVQADINNLKEQSDNAQAISKSLFSEEMLDLAQRENASERDRVEAMYRAVAIMDKTQKMLDARMTEQGKVLRELGLSGLLKAEDRRNTTDELQAVMLFTEKLVSGFSAAATVFTGFTSTLFEGIGNLDFAKQNVEAFLQLKQQISEINRSTAETFHTIDQGLKRNQTSYYDYVNAIQDAEKDRYEQIMEAEKQYQEALKKTDEVFKENFLQPIAQGIKDGASSAVSSFGESLNDALKGITGFEGVQQAFDQLFGVMRPEEMQLMVDQLNTQEGIVQAIYGTNRIIEKISKDINVQPELIARAIASPSLPSATDLATLSGNDPSMFGSAVNAVAGIAASSTMQTIIMVLTPAFQALSSIVMPVFEAALNGNTEELVMFIEKFISELPSVITEVVQSFTEAFPRIMETIVKGIPAIVDTLLEALPVILSTIIAELPSLITTSLMQAMKILPTLLLELFTKGPDFIIAIYEGILKALMEPEFWFNMLKAVMLGVIGAILYPIEVIVIGVSKLVNFFTKSTSAPFSIMRAIGSLIMHDGGIVGGPRGKEVPAVLQAGEGVLSLKAMQALGTDNFKRINAGMSINPAAAIMAPSMSSSTTNNNLTMGNVSINFSGNAPSSRAEAQMLSEEIVSALDRKLAKRQKNRSSFIQ
jgi:hypothetical protein